MAVQVDGLFATGLPADAYELPHPRIELPVIFVVRRVLIRAFEILRQRGFSFATSQEDEITVALEGIIENDLRQKNGDPRRGGVPGFTRDTFDAVSRHQCVTNHDGTKLKKEPDLCFRLRSEEHHRVVSTQYALFIECKPVDRTHAAGSAYCDDGLQRFIDGDYAWAMGDALMLAYVRDGRTISGHLLPAMQEHARKSRLRIKEMPSPLPQSGARATAEAEVLHRSRHLRAFQWLQGKGRASEIFIYHAWHGAD